MILKTVRIKNYKCIRDSDEFRIDEKVTCLVGKNESGKTAILQTLAKLNPIDATEAFFDELEYPRHRLSEYDENYDSGDTLTTTWALEDDDVTELQEIIGPAATQIGAVTIAKGYANKVQYSVDVDEVMVLTHLIDSHELMADEKTDLEGISTVAELQKRLTEVPDRSHRQKNLLDKVSETFGGTTARQRVIDFIAQRLPKLAYFSEYLRMPGQVSVNDINERQLNHGLPPGHQVFLALLSMIGREIPDLEEITQHERLIADLEGASNQLTKETFRYWTQNRHLRVNFRFEQALAGDPAPFNRGWILRTRIENTRQGVTTGFDQRSAGFVWFFSFLVWFSQVKKKYGDRLIVLLDEPGLSLHARAQSDLLRYFEEKLTPDYQVIYTTHSPFMIDPANLQRARTVEDIFLESPDAEPAPDEADLGTKVGDAVLSRDRDTLFPLQACLGYEISQSLFIGEHTLLVGGPAELLYLEWFKRKLAAMGRTTLNQKWVICPCGGIDKVPAFMSLFAGNELSIAVLTDSLSGEIQRVKDLQESKLLRNGHVLTADMYTGRAEADIEDMIGRETYIEIVNQAYSLDAEQKIPFAKPFDAPSRVTEEVADHFRTLPADAMGFDRYVPAEFLTKAGLEIELPEIELALDRFETLFRDLNSLI
jgi:predicted ATP-dependent endonuclease of OLD family